MRQYQEPKGITQSNTLLTARMGWLSQSAGGTGKGKSHGRTEPKLPPTDRTL